MGKYRDHREPRRRRNDHDAASFDRAAEPSYFQRSPAAGLDPLDAEVLWFNDGKGFGFIKLQDGSEAYLHARVLEAAGRRDISDGIRLKVTVEESPRGRQVSQVLEIGQAIATVSSPAGHADGGSEGSGTMETAGTVKWYNPDKGFGFIAPESGGKDVFVHATALGRSGLAMLSEGQRVFIESGQGKKGPEVRSIRIRED
jgi:CspA family cold shock protein